MTPARPFGPGHPYKQTTEMARKAGKIAAKKSPWGKWCPGLFSKRKREGKNEWLMAVVR
jgi:hypothetical protein